MSARAFMIPAWTEDVGALRATEGVVVYEKCSRCSAEGIVDLDHLIASRGPRYSLWNRHPPCHKPQCSGQRWFRAQPANYFHKIMENAPEEWVAKLHDRWCATLEEEIRDDLPAVRLMDAADMVLLWGCGECQLLWASGVVNYRSWASNLSLNDIVARTVCNPKCELVADFIPRSVVPPEVIEK